MVSIFPRKRLKFCILKSKLTLSFLEPCPHGRAFAKGRLTVADRIIPRVRRAFLMDRELLDTQESRVRENNS